MDFDVDVDFDTCYHNHLMKTFKFEITNRYFNFIYLYTLKICGAMVANATIVQEASGSIPESDKMFV